MPPYIVDFLCLSHKLIVEIDGATHGEMHEVRYDEKRTAFLEGQGFKVLRFWNDGVYKSIDAVLDAILFALQRADLRQGPLSALWAPSPYGGRVIRALNVR